MYVPHKPEKKNPFLSTYYHYVSHPGFENLEILLFILVLKSA
jgi:hypothetical protein